MSRWYSLFVAVSALFFSTLVIGNQCNSILPTGATPSGHVKLCQSNFSGITSVYGCQDYQLGNDAFRVMYKGGLMPKAIVKLSSQSAEQLIWAPGANEASMHCPLNAPIAIPLHAKHCGLGICLDNNNKAIACSVYEHAPARQKQTVRYLIFYHQDGSGGYVEDPMTAGNNENAMVAELAFQLGLNLLENSCCGELATGYLEHAHRLFPKHNEYRAGYAQALEQLVSNAL